VAAKLAAWVNYICPVEGAREEMEKIDPDLVENPLIFPDEETLAKTMSFMALNEAQITQYEGEFAMSQVADPARRTRGAGRRPTRLALRS
jgi:spermidine/putrescine transport system substrate-binding protein